VALTGQICLALARYSLLYPPRRGWQGNLGTNLRSAVVAAPNVLEDKHASRVETGARTKSNTLNLASAGKEHMERGAPSGDTTGGCRKGNPRPLKPPPPSTTCTSLFWRQIVGGQQMTRVNPCSFYFLSPTSRIRAFFPAKKKGGRQVKKFGLGECSSTVYLKVQKQARDRTTC